MYETENISSNNINQTEFRKQNIQMQNLNVDCSQLSLLLSYTNAIMDKGSSYFEIRMGTTTI